MSSESELENAVGEVASLCPAVEVLCLSHQSHLQPQPNSATLDPVLDSQNSASKRKYLFSELVKQGRADFGLIYKRACSLPLNLRVSACLLSIWRIGFYVLSTYLAGDPHASAAERGVSELSPERLAQLEEKHLQREASYRLWLEDSFDLESMHGILEFSKSLGLLIMALVAPLVPLLMIWHACGNFRKKKKVDTLGTDNEYICLPQFRYNLAPDSATFFLSGQFSWTILAVVASGIPAFFSLWLYYALGIDAMFGYPSHDPHFKTTFVIIMLYMYSLGCCICCLFFRAYFSLPWGTDDNEYAVELQPNFARQLSTENWIFKFFCPHEASYVRIVKWSEAYDIVCQNIQNQVQVSADQSSSSAVFADVRRSFPWFYTLLRFVIGLQDRMRMRAGESETIVIKGSTREGCARSVSIKLGSLSKRDRARVFAAVRKWAPHLAVRPEVQKALIGSVVLNDPRYTHIWFDLLLPQSQTSAGESLRLAAGDSLKDGRFTVLERLDSGGQATVYLGQDSLANRKIVLKEFVLTPGESIEALVASASDFDNESAVLSRLKHPKIVKMIDLFLNGHRAYLVLEYVEGRSLRKVVEQDGALNETAVAELAVQMCDILEYMHAEVPPIVHRDFTPENIILQSDGKLKLIDFSIAKQATEVSSGECAGKHAYTPPEQFRSEETTRTDIYALGATLYFLLCAEDPEPISVSSPRLANGAVSETIDRIVAKCTALEAEQRYEDVAWLRLELQQWLQDRIAKCP